MNKKRKILTVAGMVVFGMIMWSHYTNDEHIRLTTLLAFGVFYAGLYALLGGESKPRNWRRIIKVTGLIVAGLVVIAGSIGAIIYIHNQELTRQWHIESEKRERAEKIEKEKKEQAEKLEKEIEEEASKHRITSNEIDLLDLQFLRLKSPRNDGSDPFVDPFNPFAGYKNGYVLQGRIRNRSSHTLASIKLIVKLRDKSGDLRGEKTARIHVNAPPGQTRAIGHPIYFDDDVYPYTWDYAITEIRGSKGSTNPFDQFGFAELTPTPTP